MDTTILLILAQDGVVNGAVYAMLALALVLVFAVTRVIFVPQGELVAFGALTYAALDAGRLPGSLWLLLGAGLAAAAATLRAERHALSAARLARIAAECLALPLAVAAAIWLILPLHPVPWVSAVLTLAIVAPLAPLIYRIAFRPLAEASVLVLLIAAIGVHLALTGFGLVFFGPEGWRARGVSEASFPLGPLSVSAQSLAVLGAAAGLMAALFAFFGRTLLGKALHATAVNRLGARLVGIATTQAGLVAFTLAGLIGAGAGILIAPLTTIYYDSGFLIGLKGFVAAIVAGLVSYPGAAAAAVLVGLVESFASFWASAFKEVIVFTVIIPVLLWRSLRASATEDDE